MESCHALFIFRNNQAQTLEERKQKFLIDIGTGVSATLTDTKSARLSFIFTYIRDTKKVNTVKRRIAVAANNKNTLLHFRKIKGALYLIANLRKVSIKKWTKKQQRVLVGGIIVGLLIYAGIHPGLVATASKVVEYLTK